MGAAMRKAKSTGSMSRETGLLTSTCSFTSKATSRGMADSLATSGRFEESTVLSPLASEQNLILSPTTGRPEATAFSTLHQGDKVKFALWDITPLHTNLKTSCYEGFIAITDPNPACPPACYTLRATGGPVPVLYTHNLQTKATHDDELQRCNDLQKNKKSLIRGFVESLAHMNPQVSKLHLRPLSLDDLPNLYVRHVVERPPTSPNRPTVITMTAELQGRILLYWSFSNVATLRRLPADVMFLIADYFGEVLEIFLSAKISPATLSDVKHILTPQRCSSPSGP